MEEFTVEKIPSEKRIRNALITLTATVGLTGWALWYLYSQQQFGENALWLLPFFGIGLWVSFHYWRTTEVKKPTLEVAQKKEEEGKLENQKIAREWGKIVSGLGVLVVLAGFVIVGWQIFTYLKHGEWVELPLLILAALGPEKFVSWLANPSSWLGLHKLLYGFLKFFPVSLFTVLVGAAMVVYGINKTEA